MANDRPTSLRMGFGYKQARAAGAPYVEPPTVNKMNWDLKEKKAEKQLRSLTQLYPYIAPRLKEVIAAHAAEVSRQDIFFLANCLVASESKTGFVVKCADGKTFESRKVTRMFVDAIEIIHEGRPFMLYKHYIENILPRTPRRIVKK